MCNWKRVLAIPDTLPDEIARLFNKSRYSVLSKTGDLSGYGQMQKMAEVEDVQR